MRVAAYLSSDRSSRTCSRSVPWIRCQSGAAPEPEGMIDRAPGWQVVGPQFPGTAAVHRIEDAVENLVAAMPGRLAAGLDGGHERHQLFPFCIGEIGIVRASRRSHV